MVCTFSSIRNKEIVNLRTGLKIGFADDLELDPNDGRIVSMIVYGRPRAFGLMGRDEDMIIKCSNIRLIGEDTILVDLTDDVRVTKSGICSVDNLLKTTE
ncbi:MAG: YlmC/YmxH family sporulation protein [Ruminococcus sp.]|nr:YlmC/YmxH family sporulation protein [Ruminococcus sp.]